MAGRITKKLREKYRAVFFDRLVWFLIVTILLFGLLVVTLFQLQLQGGDSYAAQMEAFA